MPKNLEAHRTALGESASALGRQRALLLPYPFIGINGIWVLAIILGLTGASCTTHQSAVPVKDGVVSQGPQAKPPPSSEPGAVSKVKIQAAYGKLPLSFEANQGQTDGEVKFLSRGSGYSLFLTPTEAVLVLQQPSAVSIENSRLSTSVPSPHRGGG